ncbi:MAG TPA: GNAT family N-acetyltransferase [Nitrososphaeraceae archaeon]
MNIEFIDDNESSFCYLWSRAYQKIDCVELFSNDKLGDDYFFNRLNIRYPCNNVVEILNSIKGKRTSDINTYYIHLKCDTKNSINLNMPKFGTMKILGFDVDNNYVLNTTKKIEIDQVYNHDLEKWIDIFCMSFDSLGIKDEVTSIISKHYRKLTLLVAHFNLDHGMYPVGCCLLFEKNNNIGLYCLGTIHHFRNKGVARQLIGNAIKIAKDNDYNTLVLQSLTEEKYGEFYKKLGFRTIYKKQLFTFNLN